MISNSILVLAIYFSVASILISAVAILTTRLTRSLPFRHAILLTGLAVCIASPLAISTGWIGNCGWLPALEAKAFSAPQENVTASYVVRSKSNQNRDTHFGESSPAIFADRESSIEPKTQTEPTQGSSPAAQASLPVNTASKPALSTPAFPTQIPSQRIPPVANFDWPTLFFGSLVVIWILGTAACALTHILQWRRAKQLLATCRAVEDPRLMGLAKDSANRLGLLRCPDLLTSASILFPAVIGIRNPKLVVPDSFDQLGSDSELQAMLSHELAHVRRNDHRTIALQIVAASLYWWNPLVHRVCANISAVRELICDDIAIQDVGCCEDYARSIVAIAEEVSRRPKAVMQLGMSAGNLEQRIERLLDRKGELAPTRISRALTCSLIVAGVLSIGSLVVAQVPTAASLPGNQPETVIQKSDSPSAGTSTPKTTLEVKEEDDDSTDGELVTIGTAPLCLATGLVLNVDGEPATNAIVEIVRARKPVGKVKTNSEGKFKFRFNSNFLGRSTIHAKSADGKTETSSANGLLYNKIPTDTTHIELKLEKLVRHEVKVQDQNGDALENIPVFAFATRSSTHRFSGFTNAKGIGVFHIPESQSIMQVVAFDPAKGIDYKSYTQPHGQENRFVETESFPSDGPETLTIGPPSPFTVKVVDQDQNPLAGASVYPWVLEKAGYSTLNLTNIYDLARQKTDMAGETRFEWFPEWQKKPVTIWPEKAGHDSPRGVYRPGSKNKSTIQLQSLTQIQGRVIDQAGNPVAGIRVKANGKKCHEQHCETTTDENGNYKLYVRPDQSIIIVVRDRKVTDPRQVSTFAKVDVPSSGETISGCDLKITPAVLVHAKFLNRTTGKLVSGHRSTMSRIAMTPQEYQQRIIEDPEWHVKSYNSSTQEMWYKIPSIWDGGIKTANGEFDMHLAPGVYRIRANDDDQSQLFVIKEDKETEIEISTKAGAETTIKGTITVEGKPASNAQLVAVNKRFRGDRWEATSNDAGEFNITTREEPGLLTAFSRDKAFAVAVRFETPNLRTDLKLKKVATIKGRLLDAKGKPLAETRVNFGTKLHVAPYGGFVVTDKNGLFEIPHVCPEVSLVLGVIDVGDQRQQVLAKLEPLAPGQILDLQDLRLSEPRIKPGGRFR